MRRRIALALALGLLAVLAGCIPRTAHDRFIDIAMDEGYTRREAEALYDAALKAECMVQTEDGYEVDHSIVSVDDVYETVQSILDDLRYVLTSDRWMALYEALPSLRVGFLRAYDVWRYVESQIGQVKLYFDFLNLLGTAARPYSLPYTRSGDNVWYYEHLGYGAPASGGSATPVAAPASPPADQAYSIEYLYPGNTEFDWTPEYIAEARARGALQEVEREFVYLFTPYGERVPDPLAGDDGAWVWRPKTLGFVIISYAILNAEPPREDVQADYCEVWRAELVGDRIQTESAPCVRAFRTYSGRGLAVLIVDYDREGDAGWGTIDEVLQASARMGSELYSRQQALFEQVAAGRKEVEEEFPEPVLPELSFLLAPVGEIEEYKGEFSVSGWQVPYEYKDEYDTNWTVRVRFADTEEGYPWKQLEHVIKVYDRGPVYEYWLPSPPYDGDLELCTTAGRNITIQVRDGELKTIPATQVCGTLYMIVYRDGSEWVQIYDADEVGILQYLLRGVPAP